MDELPKTILIITTTKAKKPFFSRADPFSIMFGQQLQMPMGLTGTSIGIAIEKPKAGRVAINRSQCRPI
jgi:hypothetical protein